MTNFRFHDLLLCMVILIGFSLKAQTKIDSIQLKRGEVFDILLLTQHEGVDAELQDYFKTAFPVAKKMSYQPLPGFKITNYTQGNIQPGFLILGKWNSIENREDFLSKVLLEVPDFHERRRKIWSYFGLRYFEMQEDVSLILNRSKFHVATAYWLEEAWNESEFYEAWNQKVEDSNGKVLLELKNGYSPFGYRYDPDVFVITAWENEEAFIRFSNENQRVQNSEVKHINEYIIR